MSHRRLRIEGTWDQFSACLTSLNFQENLPQMGGSVPYFNLYGEVAHDWVGVSDALYAQTKLPDPIMRPRTHPEQTPDLNNPTFSNCTGNNCVGVLSQSPLIPVIPLIPCDVNSKFNSNCSTHRDLPFVYAQCARGGSLCHRFEVTADFHDVLMCRYSRNCL